MTDNLFETEADVEPQVDESKDYLTELVGEGKKFKTVQDLAKGKFYADQMVEILKSRQDEMREEYLKLREDNMKKATLEEFVDQIKQRSSNTEPSVKEQPEVDLSTRIEEMVSKKIQESEQSKKHLENSKVVRDKLKERFGSNFQNILKERTEALGLTESFVNDLARNHPTVLLKTLGVDQQLNQDNTFQSPPRSNQRTDSFAPTGAKERTWSYYQDLKNKNPEAWLDKRTAVQMQEDAIRLGDKFYDGNFYVKGLHEQ